MTLVDMLADWGPYAPTLIYVWFMAAYAVAGLRGRRHLTRRQRLTYPLNLVALAVFPVLMIFVSPWRTNDQRLLWWVFYNAIYFIFWPLTTARGFVNERKRWRAFGYARTTDVLLFRRPAELPMPEAVTDAERRNNRLLYWALLATAAGLMVIGFFRTYL